MADKPQSAPPFQVNEKDLKGNAQRLNRLLQLTWEQIPAAVTQAVTQVTQSAAPTTLPPEPNLGVIEASPLDTTVAYIADVTFGSDPTSVVTLTFVFYFVDDAASPYFLSSPLGPTDTSMDLTSVAGISAGDYLAILGEIVLCGTPSGTTVPITRHQLGSTATSATTSDHIEKVQILTNAAGFSAGWWVTAPEAATWVFQQALPNMRLLVVVSYSTNSVGNSGSFVGNLMGNSDHGLKLNATPSGGSSATPVLVTNSGTSSSPVVLASVAQVVNVVATSQDCYLLLPPCSSMQGIDISVNLDPSSTFSVYVVPGSGDTIQGSSSNYQINTPGSGAVFEGGLSTSNTPTNWIIKASAGAVTPAPAPNAPNITSATADAIYYLYGNASAAGFEGTITLPTGDPNYSHLKEIDVAAVDGAGNNIVVQTLYASFGGGTTVSFKGGLVFQSGSDQPFTLSFTCKNDDNVATASPFTLVVTVQASKVTAVAGREVPSSLTVDPITRLVSTKIGATPTLAGNQVPQNVSYLISRDNGTTFYWGGWDKIETVGQEITFYQIKPNADQSWKVALVAGAVGGDASKPLSVSDLPAGSIISPSFTVAGLAVPAATGITSLTVSAGAGGSFPFNQTSPDTGQQYFSIAQISYSDVGCVADPEAFFVRITAQDYGAAGTSVGPEQAFAGTSVTGEVHTFGPLSGAYGTDGFSYTRSANIAKVRLRVYVCNRINQTSQSFADPTCATLQTGVGGGAGYVDVVVASGGVLPPGKIVSSRLDPSLQIPGQTVPTGPGLTLNGSNQVVPNLSTPLTILSNQITVALAGITNSYLAAGAVAANNLQASSVTAANAAIAANAVVDSNISSMSISKLISGTVIFTGDVIMSRGSGFPVIALNSGGVYLYGASSGTSGLTSQPYVALQSSSVGFFSGGSGPSITMSGGSAFFWGVNGNSSFPYLTLSSSYVSMTYNSFQVTLSASQIQMSYLGVTLTLNTSQVKIQNGTYSAIFQAGQIQLWSVDGNSSFPFIGITSSNMYIGAGSYLAQFSASTIQLSYAGGPSLVISPSQLSITSGAYSLIASSSSLTLSVSGGSQVQVTSSQVLIQGGSNSLSKITLDSSGNAVFTNPANLSTTISGNTIDTNTVVAGSITLQLTTITWPPGMSSTSASAGSASLPSNPQGFIQIKVGAGTYKIPYYNL